MLAVISVVTCPTGGGVRVLGAAALTPSAHGTVLLVRAPFGPATTAHRRSGLCIGQYSSLYEKAIVDETDASSPQRHHVRSTGDARLLGYPVCDALRLRAQVA